MTGFGLGAAVQEVGQREGEMGGLGGALVSVVVVTGLGGLWGVPWRCLGSTRCWMGAQEKEGGPGWSRVDSARCRAWGGVLVEERALGQATRRRGRERRVR